MSINTLKFNNIQKRKLIILVFFSCFSVMVFGQSGNKTELQKRKALLEKEISDANKELQATKQSKSANLKQLVLIKRKINKREELLRAFDSEIKTIDKDMSKLNDTISKIGNKLDDLKDEYADIIVSTYRNRGSTDRLMLIFAAKNFNQAYKRIKYLEYYTDHRKEQVKTITEYRKILATKKDELEKNRETKLLLKGKEQNERNKLADEKKEKDEQTKKLTSQEKKLLTKLEKNQAAVRKLQSAIEAIVAEEIRKANEEKQRLAAEKAAKEAADKGLTAEATTAKAKPAAKPATTTSMSITAEDVALTGSFTNNKGRLPAPFDRSTVLQSFGEHPHPEFQGIRVKNNGIDFISTPSANVKAVFDGVVSSTMNIADLNYVVIIRHGDYLSVYSNLSKTYVKKGDKVKTRQVIGVAANEEEVAQSRLHFELWQGNKVMNPVPWLNM